MAIIRIIQMIRDSIRVNELERRIYNLLLLIAVLAGPLVIIGNFLQGLHIIAIINPIIITLLNLLLFYFSIVKKQMYKFLLCMAFLLFTAVQWIYNGGGSSGGMQYFFMWTFISATILMNGRKLYYYIFINCIILLGLLLYEYADGSLIVPYSNELSRLIDIIISASLTFILAAFMVHIIYSQIDREREKSEKLLLNILPKKVIQELKETGYTSPEIFKDVTILFSDIVGFTDISTKLPVEILIKELNELFTRFDIIIERNSCERIKTIGDAYLAVCGMPDDNENHCQNIVNAAIQMINLIETRNRHHQIKWQIRIGIHTGHVIGAVVGIKKYIYDVFGNTVNVASRLQTLSEPMKINISGDVIKVLGNGYQYENRGIMQARGMQKMNMYFLNPDMKRSYGLEINDMQPSGPFPGFEPAN